MSTVSRTVSASPALLAPLILALHVAEEAPGLVQWLDRVVNVTMTTEAFVAINATGLLLTLILSGLAATTRDRAAALVLLAWLSFLMLTNGLLHVTATVLYRGYSPGLITAVVLYLPYFAWYATWLRRSFSVAWSTLLATVALGAAPMLLQGYFVLFMGRRLLW